jgi:hypothetical protein
MDQSQTETVYIEDHLVGEKTPHPGRIGIAVYRPNLLPVEYIQNGQISQVTGMQNKVNAMEGMLQYSPEFFVIAPEMCIRDHPYLHSPTSAQLRADYNEMR